MNPYVFLSFSNLDKPVAAFVCEWLEDQGIKCWIYYRDVVIGACFPIAIEDSLPRCSVLILFYSSSTRHSIDVLDEVVMARQARKPIIWIRIEDAELTN